MRKQIPGTESVNFQTRLSPFFTSPVEKKCSSINIYIYTYRRDVFFNSSCFTRHYTRLVIVFFGNICNHLHARVRFVSTEEPDPVRSSSVKPLWLQTASCVASRCLVNMIEILMDVFHQKVLWLLLPAGVSVICWGGLEVSKVTR